MSDDIRDDCGAQPPTPHAEGEGLLRAERVAEIKAAITAAGISDGGLVYSGVGLRVHELLTLLALSTPPAPEREGELRRAARDAADYIRGDNIMAFSGPVGDAIADHIDAALLAPPPAPEREGDLRARAGGGLLPCPFCKGRLSFDEGDGAHAWIHPRGNCFLSGSVVEDGEESLWNRRAPSGGAGDRPAGEQEGYPANDPKYDFWDHRIWNRADGLPVPDDEPVFVFRARDRKAVLQLERYANEVSNPDHAEAVYERVHDFRGFAQRFPERMKEPDTAAATQQAPPALADGEKGALQRDEVAAAVHRGRYPADRTPEPFEDEDASGREYCYRIADQVLLLAPPAAPKGEQGGDQAFERFPGLALHIARMATSGSTGFMLDWDAFLSELNAALTPKALSARIIAASPTHYAELLQLRAERAGIVAERDEAREERQKYASECLRIWPPLKEVEAQRDAALAELKLTEDSLVDVTEERNAAVARADEAERALQAAETRALEIENRAGNATAENAMGELSAVHGMAYRLATFLRDAALSSAKGVRG